MFAALAAALSAGLVAPPTKAAKPGDGAAFLAENARKDGVVVLPGLQYRILTSGPADGEHPKLSGMVTVHYEGRLPSGEIFDSSFARGEPATLKGRSVILGWQAILRMMRPGDEWEVWIPAELAYGAKGAGPIPPNTPIVFRIRLISFEPAPE
ncbi:MAG TPA: FKBP-type peptidyl-prolyl cis-trans isomerase [Sphingopyxis sp.]|uniref:FKBP-type peptidyl-prolyl cis-trans isomerase n=1 Tax=Sphingopyxis sp. TaxID=1908224 RepID=UPI002E149207|nr:FKBP-type peptidyl-prolyl cis-trans isomerase [Sphingopyxis sp.]